MTIPTGAEGTIPENLLGMSIKPGDRHLLAAAAKVEAAYHRAGIQPGDILPELATAKQFGLAPETPDKRLADLMAADLSQMTADELRAHYRAVLLADKTGATTETRVALSLHANEVLRFTKIALCLQAATELTQALKAVRDVLAGQFGTGD